MLRAFCILLLVVVVMDPARSADWPMWRHDSGRTASSNQALPEKENLQILWTRELPAPAPAYRDTRLGFDAGYEPIVLGKRVFVASNRDDSVSAFDTDTGEELWQYFTDGPVRFAPVAGKGRVIFGSDDGCVYCVKASDGTLVWKLRAVPSRRLILGNTRLISVWPVRGGPVLHDDRVYFAAGVWPLEGTFVFCVDAKSGEVIWRNDETSYRYGAQPHNAEAQGGLAPQGYLLIDGDDLVVPSSQAYPARFDMETGELKEFELPAAGRLPGGWFASTPAAKEAQKLKRRGLLFDSDVNVKPHEDKLRSEGLPEIRTTIRTGDREWRFADGVSEIEGEVHSMAAGDGKLFVSTKAGHLVCLGESEADGPVVFAKNVREGRGSSGDDAAFPRGAKAGDGYAVFLGVPDTDRVDSLAATTRLNVIGIESSPDRVKSLREAGWVDSAGHVTILEASPAAVELPPYLANLMVVDPSISLTRSQLESHYRALRPFGGKLISRSPDLAAVAESAGLPSASVTSDDGWTVITREGPLEGATNYTGDWSASEDELVKAPLGLLWFGDSVTHFKRSPQPKFVDGVMISNSKDWTDASTREGKVDYRLLDTTFSDVYTGRVLTPGEAPELRQEYYDFDGSTIQPSQYRPPRQDDDWKPKAPRAGERTNPLTGETEPRVFPKSYGCDGGVDYGNLYSMRSATPAFYDKRIESGTINISGPRSGCTNSVIPANGVLNLPYFYEGCTCSYPLPVALSLVSMPEHFEQWASWGDVPAEALAGKVERIGLNFGAPGDRVTEDGTLWLDLPNAGGPSPQVSVETEPPLDSLERHYQHSLFLKGGTGWPWVAGSGVSGLKSVAIEGMKPGTYGVRITWTQPDNLEHFSTGEVREVEVGTDGRLVFDTLQKEGQDTVICGMEVISADLSFSPSFEK